MKTERKRIVISIAEYFQKLWKWAPVIIAWSILCAMILLTVYKVIKEPVYTAETKVYLLSRSVGDEYDRFDMSDMQVSTQLTNDSMLVFKNEQVAEKVIANLNQESGINTQLTSGELLGMVNVSREDDSLMITIAATNPDPYLACDIANLYRTTIAEELEKKLMIRGIQTVEEAVIPLERSGRSNTMIAATGAIIGLLGMLCFLFVHYVAFDAIREPEDIKEV